MFSKKPGRKLVNPNYKIGAGKVTEKGIKAPRNLVYKGNKGTKKINKQLGESRRRPDYNKVNSVFK